MSMDRVPDAVLAYLANSFLRDLDALRLARTSHVLLRALRSTYRIARAVPFSRAVQWTVPGATDPAVGDCPAPASSSSSADAAAAPVAALTSSSAPSRMRIGLPVTVSVTRAEASRGAVGLQRLPPSVTLLVWDVPNLDADEGYDHEDSSAVAASEESCISYSFQGMWDETGDDGDGAGTENAADRDAEPEASEPPRLTFPSQVREILGFSLTRPANEVQLPPALTKLNFVFSFNGDVSALELPDGLRTLDLGYDFNQPISTLCLPALLTALRLGGFHGTVHDLPALPPGLEELEFGHNFNSPLDGLVLPPALRSLTFGSYNQSLAGVRFPQSLTALAFGAQFDQPLESVQWPQGLLSLRLGYRWNQSVKRLRLPASLTELDLGGCTQPLNWPEPPQSVTQLTLRSWNHPASQLRLPPNMTAFEAPSTFNQPLDDLALPAALRSLTMHSTRHPLSALRMPAGLTSLDLRSYCGPMDGGVRWPPSLTKLKAQSFCAAAGLLPDSIISLQLCQGLFHDGKWPWALPLRSVCLPPRLQRLALHCIGSQPLADLRAPPSLTSLSLECGFDQSLGQWVPFEGLRVLSIGDVWNRPVSDLRLPTRLEILSLGKDFNQPVDELDLPPTLTELHLGSSRFANFAQSVRGLRLPRSLRVLGLPSLGRLLLDDDPSLLDPPAAGLPPSLRALYIHPKAVQRDRLAAWDLPPRCVVDTESDFDSRNTF